MLSNTLLYVRRIKIEIKNKIKNRKPTTINLRERER